MSAAPLDPAGSKAAPAAASVHVHVRCPRCEADDANLRHRLVASSIVTCRRCGQSYVDPRVSTAEIERKLQMWAAQDVVDEERLRQAFDASALEYYARLLACIAPHLRSPGRRLLDVGCGTGAFLKVARDARWLVSGIGLGIASARFAGENLGLSVRRGSLYDFEAPAASFDAVSMIEVIEHLERPREALLRVRRMLAPQGLLLVTTPNFDSLYRRMFGARWWVVNCEDEHIVLFTLDTLAGMLADCGFEVVHGHIRGIDTLGIAREALDWIRGRQRDSFAHGAAVRGYYEARSAKARAKSALRRLGILQAGRRLLRSLDRAWMWRWSPTFAWGEQLIVVARPRSAQAGRAAPGGSGFMATD